MRQPPARAFFLNDVNLSYINSANMTSIVGNDIAGSGDLFKSGPGTLILVRQPTALAGEPQSVDGGTLLVERIDPYARDSQRRHPERFRHGEEYGVRGTGREPFCHRPGNRSGAFDVRSATIAGTGTVGSTTMNGTIIPGPGNNSIGRITINGNYVQNHGSTYDVTIAPKQSATLINVTGAAMLNGGAVDVTALLGNVHRGGLTFAILAAGSGKGRVRHMRTTS